LFQKYPVFIIKGFGELVLTPQKVLWVYPEEALKSIGFFSVSLRILSS
jgi:hypothetical protein